MFNNFKQSLDFSIPPKLCHLPCALLGPSWEGLAKLLLTSESKKDRLLNIHRKDRMTGFVHLPLGVCLYMAEFGVQNFEAPARYFNSEVRIRWTQGCYYLEMLYKNGLGVQRCDMK